MLRGEQEVIRGVATDCDRFETDHLVLYIDKGLLSRDAEQRFVSEMDRGFAATKGYLRRSFDRRLGVPKPSYYLTDRAGISHVDHTQVFLRAQRVIPSPGIAIHETAHLLMMSDRTAPRNRSDLSPEEEQRWTAMTGVWLPEGFASYVASELAPKLRIRLDGPFLKGDNSTVDAEAKQWLKDPRGRAVASFVGSRGAPENLIADRQNVAAPFYVLAQSLVKHMVARAGLATVERLYVEHTNGRASIEEDVRRITRTDLAKWRENWITSLTAGLQ